MYVFMYVCMYVCMICDFVRMQEHFCEDVNIYTYIRICICIYMYMYIYMYIYAGYSCTLSETFRRASRVHVC